MVNGIERATGSLGDVLERGVMSAVDLTRNRQKIMRANSILSRMGTVYSVFSMNNPGSSLPAALEKVFAILD
jgi:hypothetical protein